MGSPITSQSTAAGSVAHSLLSALCVLVWAGFSALEQPLMSRAQACLETGRQLGDGLMQGRALWQLGRLEGHRGQHERAAALKLAALQRLERVLGPDHLDVAKCCTGETGETLDVSVRRLGLRV